MSELNARPENRLDRRRRHTRDLLKMAAWEVLNQAGYNGMTVQAITDRADLGRGTFYVHYADKDELVWEIMRDYMDMTSASLIEQLAGEVYPRREYLSFLAIFREVHASRALFLEVFGSKGSGRLSQRYQDYMAQVYEDNITNHVYSPNIDLPPAFMAHFMAGALVRTLIWWMETEPHHSPEHVAELTFRICYRENPPVV